MWPAVAATHVDTAALTGTRPLQCSLDIVAFWWPAQCSIRKEYVCSAAVLAGLICQCWVRVVQSSILMFTLLPNCFVTSHCCTV